jgi:hypothetical protein
MDGVETLEEAAISSTKPIKACAWRRKDSPIKRVILRRFVSLGSVTSDKAEITHPQTTTSSSMEPQRRATTELRCVT